MNVFKAKNTKKLYFKKNINELKIQTGKLKGLFVQHEKKLEVLIAERKDDINYFFH